MSSSINDRCSSAINATFYGLLSVGNHVQDNNHWMKCVGIEINAAENNFLEFVCILYGNIYLTNEIWKEEAEKLSFESKHRLKWIQKKKKQNKKNRIVYFVTLGLIENQ